MSGYIIDLSIGGTMRVKVEADTEDLAKEIAERYFIEDLEDAGPLKLGDVRIDAIYTNVRSMDGPGLDASIIAIANGLDWEYAADDPLGRNPPDAPRDEPAT